MNKLPITKIAQEACRENVKAAPFKMYVNKFAGTTSQVVSTHAMPAFSKGLEEGDKIAKKTALKSANKGMIDDKNGCGEGFVYDNEKGECVPQQNDNDLTVDNSNDPNAVNLDD